MVRDTRNKERGFLAFFIHPPFFPAPLLEGLGDQTSISIIQERS